MMTWETKYDPSLSFCTLIYFGFAVVTYIINKEKNELPNFSFELVFK